MRVSGGISSLAFPLIALCACGGQAVDPDDPAAPPRDPVGDPALVPVTGPSYPSTEGMGDGSPDAMMLLNAYRALAGLDPVVDDPALGEACLGHLKYLDWEAAHRAGGECLLAHDEPDASNPFRSEAHAKAGAGSLLACQRGSETAPNPAKAVQRWIDGLYHRLPLLDPRLERVGLASFDGYTCMYYEPGVDATRAGALVLWPPNGVTGVPPTFAGHETPCPTWPLDPAGIAAEQCPSAGFVVTATWFGATHLLAGQRETPVVSLTRGDATASIPILAVYASGVEGLDPIPGSIPDTIAMVPEGPLPAGVPVVATIESRSVTTWTFAAGTTADDHLAGR